MQKWVPVAVFFGGGLPFVLADPGDVLPMWLQLTLGGVNAGIVALLGFVGRAPGTARLSKKLEGPK